MLYMRCPTCGELLGNKQLEYEKQKNEILNSNKSDEEKRDLIGGIFKKIGIRDRAYCCKSRFRYVNDVTLIK